MGDWVAIQSFVDAMARAECREVLTSALDEFARRMGFAHYALTHHVDIRVAGRCTIRLDNYPTEWVAYFDRHRLGISDPIHRASQRKSMGFRWSELSSIIPLTAGDRRILELARLHGLTEGFTIPSHIAGEAHGSCSFAIAPGHALPDEAAPFAQWAGGCAFEGARRIWHAKAGLTDAPVQITDRQRDCVLWLARGKTAWETARILGISQETVIQHFKQARDRYGVQKSTTLLIKALFDGTLCFDDIFDA